MQNDQTLTLVVAKRSDFRPAVAVLATLTILSALLSPSPISLLVIVLLIFLAMWSGSTLGFFKVNNVNLISVIFPEGKVRLDCGSKGIIEGVLDGGQWCTRHIAVLRITSKRARVQNLVVLSKQQDSEDEFRRLHTWLRLGADKRIRQRQVLAG